MSRKNSKGMGVRSEEEETLLSPSFFFYSVLFPRKEMDHGTTVFHCRPCLNVVGDRVTVACDHGVFFMISS